ncbi:hypothetical protein ACLQ26_27045 [Micromonospora sp. DT43]
MVGTILVVASAIVAEIAGFSDVATVTSSMAGGEYSQHRPSPPT